MGYVYYRLNFSSHLQGMAPPALIGGGFGAAALPGGMAGVAGMYIIINCNGPVENRYVGISSNIGNRFNTRMATVTEMGISAATLANIHVVWGTVKIRNHPGALAPAPTVATQLVGGGGFTNFYHWGGPGWTLALPGAGGGPFVRMIDGAPVNLEHLLIRFVMTQLGAGGTVSNNLLMAPFLNGFGPGATPLHVKFYSAPFGPYGGFTRAAILAGGGAW
jgi:hypothetical protein